MEQRTRWTVAVLDREVTQTDDGTRYEIIDGELFVSKQPDALHQWVVGVIQAGLFRYGQETGRGYPFVAPGVIFTEDNAVAPDLIWVRSRQGASAIGPDGKFHRAPDLVVEVLSPGAENVRRDRERKLGVYGRFGVPEYWIVDWRRRSIDVYRRSETGLALAETPTAPATLTSPHLPGFALDLAALFAPPPI